MIKIKKVNIKPLFEMAGLEVEEIEIVETLEMYPYKDIVEDNWAYYTICGCKELKKKINAEGKKVEDIGIIGICSGVEGIGIVHVFSDTIKSLTVTDIDEEIIKGTLKNLKATTNRFNYYIKGLVGLFCEPFQENKIKLDLVHGNIPNLPTTGDENLSDGDQKGSFAPSNYYVKYNPPQIFVDWALPAQCAYLKSAYSVLRDGGSVIMELGGRVPFVVIKDLFDQCGFKVEELVVGFKRQTEAEINFVGYHRNEIQYGVSFDYYLYEESHNLLASKQIKNPTNQYKAEEIKKMLGQYRVSAGEAIELYKKNIEVGHIVHLLRGTKK